MSDQRFEDLRAVIDMAASRFLPAFIVRHASSMIDDLEREAHAMAVSAYMAAPPPVDMAPFVGVVEESLAERYTRGDPDVLGPDDFAILRSENPGKDRLRAAMATHVARPPLVAEPEIKYPEPAPAAASSYDPKAPRPERRGKHPTHKQQCKVCGVLASIGTPLERGQVERALADDGISAAVIVAEFAERGIAMSLGAVWRHRAWTKKER